ncbi:geranylgeranyl-diphosphate geranylgeranyltransferase [Halobacteriales archaeon QS_7_69_60]|nr:MAG: geranylgeranyl-diphosphate geranylgeranyltransferase [Halobacteriales archaeon QS_7_69_60]
MVDDTQLAESRSIHRQTGKTFYFATRLLPERVRQATYVLYAFFRVADEIVDDPGEMSADEQRERLLEVRDAALGRRDTDDPVLSAFSEVREEYGIPDEEVEVFIEAMLTDIEKSRYETYDEVEAFQLTNFVRDVHEDIVDRDRVYLPLETLEACGAAPEDVERRRFTDELANAIEHELRRAERLYREGVAGIKYLPKDCQLPVLAAAVLYADHHRLIRANDLDTVTREPSLGTIRKVVLVARTRWHWFWSDDPETVFEKVSGISMHDRSPTAGPGEPMPMR